MYYTSLKDCCHSATYSVWRLQGSAHPEGYGKCLCKLGHTALISISKRLVLFLVILAHARSFYLVAQPIRLLLTAAIKQFALVCVSVMVLFNSHGGSLLEFTSCLKMTKNDISKPATGNHHGELVMVIHFRGSKKGIGSSTGFCNTLKFLVIPSWEFFWVVLSKNLSLSS